MVGVEVNVGVGTVGVRVGAVVGVFVKVMGRAVGCVPKNSLTVMEQAESRVTKTRRREIFFMWMKIPS
jgi:hypothetical protein